MKETEVYQFKIKLLGIQPEIWRRIQVPSNYTFWDLHVAIQDSMGWLDCHLHEFRFYENNKSKRFIIGITDELVEDPFLFGREIPIYNYFVHEGEIVIYHYDFGADWYHQITFEGVKKKTRKNGKYPKCIDGKRACPPEDCGGVTGYIKLLNILKTGKGKKYIATKEWLSAHTINYFPYKPNTFETNKVKFIDPEIRWKMSGHPRVKLEEQYY